MNLEQRVIELEKELLIKNQLLGLVLSITGEVIVPEENVENGLVGKSISVEEAGNSLIFKLVDSE